MPILKRKTSETTPEVLLLTPMFPPSQEECKKIIKDGYK